MMLGDIRASGYIGRRVQSSRVNSGSFEGI